ncbi:hypothetical protein PsAD46_05444 [Pseudovibrio sp. Ad46]|nr:hypothetical protein PsAD46_05444 [Pseudovibrio sp. Ad46]
MLWSQNLSPSSIPPILCVYAYVAGCWRSDRQFVVGWVGLLEDVTHLSVVR